MIGLLWAMILQICIHISGHVGMETEQNLNYDKSDTGTTSNQAQLGKGEEKLWWFKRLAFKVKVDLDIGLDWEIIAKSFPILSLPKSTVLSSILTSLSPDPKDKSDVNSVQIRCLRLNLLKSQIASGIYH